MTTQTPEIYLTRKEHFSAAHRLENVNLSREENEQIFGKCINIHGHNYIVKVTIKGTANPRTGMLMNITDLKRLLSERVIAILDHKFIDNDVEYFRRIPSTSENIAVWIWRQLENYLPDGVRLHRVKLRETENNYAEFYG